MKRIINIILLALFLSISYVSITSATIVGPACKYKINFNAPLDQPACSVIGGNCCGDF